MRGLPVLVYEIGENAGRDVAIASLLRAKVKDAERRSLCGVSHGLLCKVRARLRAGGIAEVVRDRPAGRPRAMSSRMRTVLAERRAQGMSQRALAAELGVAPPIVARELLAMTEKRAQQVALESPAQLQARSQPSAETTASPRESSDDDRADAARASACEAARAPLAAPAHAAPIAAEPSAEADEAPQSQDEELAPGEPLPSGATSIRRATPARCSSPVSWRRSASGRRWMLPAAYRPAARCNHGIPCAAAAHCSALRGSSSQARAWRATSSSRVSSQPAAPSGNRR